MTKLFSVFRRHHFSTIFHIGALVHHLFIFFYMNFVIDPTSYIQKHQYIRLMAEFSFRYFTCWNFVMQFWYFSVSLVYDFLQMTDSNAYHTAKKTAEWLRNYTFRAFAFPMAFTVCVKFWGLFSLDRSFVFPVEAELVVPSWCNHAIHTNIALLMLVEIAITCHGYSLPKTRHTAIFGLTTLSFLYIFCYVGTYYQHGVWLYPIYEILNWTQRVFLMTFSYVLSIAVYLCGEGLSSKIWANQIHEAQHAHLQKMKLK